MNQDQLRQVYEMVDNIPFSKPKKHINRDFSDGLMMAELIHYYNPKIIQIHNYPSTNSVNKKIQNWTTLNDKVLKKVGLSLTKNQIQEIANARSEAIQKFLYRVLIKFERPQEQFKITNRQGNKLNLTNQSFIQKSAFTNIENRQLKIQNKHGNTINIRKEATDSQQILQMIDKIDEHYSKLLKLQEMNKLKQDMIRNLQKKVQKIIFN